MQSPKSTGGSLVNDVIGVVSRVPYGKVTTYGQIARLSGHPGASRSVGRALGTASHTADIPWHRVVNSSGRTVPGWDEQKQLLEAEGVAFKDNGCVDMTSHIWVPEA